MMIAVFNRHSPDEQSLRRLVDLVNTSSFPALRNRRLHGRVGAVVVAANDAAPALGDRAGVRYAFYGPMPYPSQPVASQDPATPGRAAQNSFQRPSGPRIVEVGDLLKPAVAHSGLPTADMPLR